MELRKVSSRGGGIIIMSAACLLLKDNVGR